MEKNLRSLRKEKNLGNRSKVQWEGHQSEILGKTISYRPSYLQNLPLSEDLKEKAQQLQL